MFLDARSRFEDLVNLPREVNSFDVDDVLFTDNIDNRVRNSRSVATSLQPPVSITKWMQQQVDFANYFHQRRDHQDDEEDSLRPKFEPKRYAVKVQNSGFNGNLNNNAIRGFFASEINDKNSTKAFEAMLTIIQVTPALTEEVYKCLKDSPAYQTVMKSLRLDEQLKNAGSHTAAAR